MNEAPPRRVASWHCPRCEIDEQAVPGADTEDEKPRCPLCVEPMEVKAFADAEA